MKTVRLIPYYATEDYSHKREVNRMLSDFGAALRRTELDTLEPEKKIHRHLLALVNPPCLSVVVGFSRFTAPEHRHPCVVVQESPSDLELTLSQRLAATLGGNLNRGLRLGTHGYVLDDVDFVENLPLPRKRAVAIILGKCDCLEDALAVNRAGTRLWDAFSREIKAVVA